MIKIGIETRTLSDGSMVHNVHMVCKPGVIVLGACTEQDAFELAEKFRDAIREHTVDAVDPHTDEFGGARDRTYYEAAIYGA